MTCHKHVFFVVVLHMSACVISCHVSESYFLMSSTVGITIVALTLGELLLLPVLQTEVCVTRSNHWNEFTWDGKQLCDELFPSEQQQREWCVPITCIVCLTVVACVHAGASSIWKRCTRAVAQQLMRWPSSGCACQRSSTHWCVMCCCVWCVMHSAPVGVRVVLGVVGALTSWCALTRDFRRNRSHRVGTSLIDFDYLTWGIDRFNRYSRNRDRICALINS
jgi:hypothetical protein